MNVAYSGSSSWVSLSGTAAVVDDRAKLAELWNTFTDAWMEGGPENPNNVLIKVDAALRGVLGQPRQQGHPGGEPGEGQDSPAKRFEGDNETGRPRLRTCRGRGPG